MSDEEIDLFHSNLREVMLYIKYSEDKERLAELVMGDERFKTMDKKAARVINSVTGSKLELEEITIEPIYHAALQCAPEYDCNTIYNLLMKQ